MTAQLLPAPKWRLTKNDGTPAANYVVYTYTTGGAVTAKPTYTTADQSVSNGASVTLNSRGEADIWWDGLYYIAVYKSAADGGGLLFAMDNYGETGSGNLVFPNRIGNGSFEDGVDAAGHPNGWDVTTYTGSTFAVDDTDSAHGGSSAKGVSIGNGGAQLITEDFTPCDESNQIEWRFLIKSTVADVRNLVEIVWYDADQALLSATSIYDNSTTNPTSWTAYQGIATPVASARYFKIRATLCHASDATAGTSRIDGIEINSILPKKYAPDHIQNIGYASSVNAKALTVARKTQALADPSAYSPVEIAFRNRTETVGDYVVRAITAAHSIVAPNGATLGFAAAEAGSIYIYECDNGTIRETGLIKKALLDESRLHNTTAISATADADNVLYTTTAMTNAAVRLTGRLDITTGAVAGEWDNEDTRVTLWTPSVGHRSDYVTFNNASPGTTITAADTTIGASKELVVGVGDIVFCESVLAVTKGATAGKTRLQLVNSGTATVVGLSGQTDDRYQPASVQYYFRHGWIVFVTAPGTLTFTLSSASSGSDATANSYSVGAFTIR